MAQSSKNDFCISLSDLANFLNQTPEQIKTQFRELIGLPIRSTWLLPTQVRQILLSANFQYPNKTISFQMLKGGVAKTSSALNIGLRAAQFGARVLFIDLDQQANLSFALGVEDENLPVWLNIVEKNKTVDECVISIEPQVDLIPSGLDNSILDRTLLNSNRNWAHAVKQPLEKIKHRYDLIIIDTAPALSAINTAAAVASDEIILPVNPDKFAMRGLEKNLQELTDIQKDFDLNFAMRILFTKYDGREKASHEFLQNCIDLHENIMLKNYIRTSSEVKNSIRADKTIFAGKSAVKDDYNHLALEMMGWE